MPSRTHSEAISTTPCSLKCMGTMRNRKRATVQQSASDAAGANHRSAEIAAHLYQPCRTAEPNHAHEDAPFHAPNECVLKEAGKPPVGNCPSLHALQLLPHTSNATRYSRHGRGNCGSRLDNRRSS